MKLAVERLGWVLMHAAWQFVLVVVAAGTLAESRADDPAGDDERKLRERLDVAPTAECKQLIERLDAAGDVRFAAVARERLAERWRRIARQPVATFTRVLPKPAPGVDERGERIGIQVDLDGVWSEGKGSAEGWKDWIVRKQNDYRVGRMHLLFKAAQGYREVRDDTAAVRVLQAGLAGHEIYDAEPTSLVRKYWPISSDEPAKSLGPGPEAWTLVNYLGELSAAQQSLDQLDQAIATHWRLLLAQFMLSWNQPSAGPTKVARELWGLVRRSDRPLPNLFWFNALDETNPKRTFDLAGAGDKQNPLTYHHYNLVAPPTHDFRTLKVTAELRGQKGLLDCYRINAEGKHESVGRIEPSGAGESSTVTRTITIPPGTGLVQFMVAGNEFRVGKMTVEATFAKREKR